MLSQRYIIARDIIRIAPLCSYKSFLCHALTSAYLSAALTLNGFIMSNKAYMIMYTLRGPDLISLIITD